MDALTQYSNDVENIICYLPEINLSNMSDIINDMTNTLYKNHKFLEKPKFREMVKFLIQCKYEKKYVFSKDVSPNEHCMSESNDLPFITALLDDVSETSSNEKHKSSSSSESEDLPFDNNLLDDISDTSSKIENVALNSPLDLVSNKHDYGHTKFTEETYLRRQKRIVEIKKIPQAEQKSVEWLEQRTKCITATAIATVLDEDPYKYPAELLMDKCFRGVPFVENENVHHGKKYEEIGSMYYAFRNNIDMNEYGLLQDDTYPFIGASPDGICEKTTKDGKGVSTLVGRLLEIKFPKTRQILTTGNLNGDICPRQYYLQCLTQMFVTKMDECDFLQCKMEEYASYEDFLKDSQTKLPGLSKQTNLEKGCIIQLLPKKMINDDPKMCLYNGKYLYPPKLHMTRDETEKWIANEVINFSSNELSKEYMIDRVIYWKLAKVACHLIKADTEYMMSKIPMLEQFWKYVEFYREHEDKLDNIEKYIKEQGPDKSADIFKRVNKHYLEFHKKSQYEPLYQEDNEWRMKFNKKKEAMRARYGNKRNYANK